MATEAETAIAALLGQTEAAYGDYQTRELGGEFDQNWADWYAAYLIDNGLPALLGGRMPSVDGLSARLKRLDEAYRRQQPAAEWPVFYAARLVAGG